MKCCLCGNEITKVHWAIRDYQHETYFQWVWRHVKTLFKIRGHKQDDSLPVCDMCRVRAKLEYGEVVKPIIIAPRNSGMTSFAINSME